MQPNTPSQLMEQIAQLSPEKRALLELKLKKKLQGTDNKPSAVRREHRTTAPLSFTQQRFWFLDQLEPDLPIYNEWTAVRLGGPLDIAVLEQSINAIVRRHEALRTTFAVRNGQPVQVIAPVLTIPLPIIDCQILPETARWAEVKRLTRAETERPFDLERGPLFRAALFQIDAQESILLLTFHHIVIDAWSATVFYRELGALYVAFLQKQPAPLADLPVQYADFAMWQHEWLQSRAFDDQLAYWQKQLADLSPLQLLTDRPRPHKQTFRGAQPSITFSDSLVKSLRTLSQQAGTSLFMTLLAAFQTLLYRYTGQDDIVVGSPIANRNRPEIEGLIGCFTNTLVLRADFAGDPTFRTLLSRVRSTVLDALAHQDLPFEKLVEELQPERDLSRTPLFQVMFVFNNTALNFDQFGTVQAEPVDVASTLARFDLTLSVMELETGLKAHVEYNADLFDAATIERMVGHFHGLLENIVAQPDQSVQHLPLLTPPEYHQLAQAWNDTRVDFGGPQTIHARFEQQAAHTPDAVALVFENTQLTYAQLNMRANQLAHHLIGLGVQADTLVAVMMDRSIDLVVSLLAVLKAGGAYVPIDPSYPSERIRYMLADSAAPILLTHTQFLLSNDMAYSGTQVIAVDRMLMQRAAQPNSNPQSATAPQQLIYAIYTSGSTGQPKGAGVYHHSFMNLLNWFITEFGLNATDKVLLISSPSFDLTQKNIFAPLLIGGCLHLLKEYEPAHIAQLICQHNITWINCTPSAFYPLLEQSTDAVANQQALRQLSPLRYLFLGGEPIAMTRLQSWMRSETFRATLVNTYGPTECADICAAYVLAPDFTDKLVPIGRPIYQAQLFILDKARQLLPIGIAGELYIGGKGLGCGYLNRPDLTAERFIEHPQFGRLYKTGDLCRWLADGNIEYLGRTDFQIKLRGFHIELGEIENALLAQPGVHEAVVMVREDTPGDKRLVAYLVTASERATLRQTLAQQLPDYMMPSAFVLLDALPLTPNGKVDRRALPAPVAPQRSPVDTFAPPSTPTEESIAAIWRAVLGLEQIGIHDDFFAIGGHSLLATQVISRCREAFRAEIALLSLFEARTIAVFAARIEQIKLTQALQQQVAPTTEMREEIAL